MSSCQQCIDTYPVRGLVPLVAIFLQGRVSSFQLIGFQGGGLLSWFLVLLSPSEQGGSRGLGSCCSLRSRGNSVVSFGAWGGMYIAFPGEVLLSFSEQGGSMFLSPKVGFRVLLSPVERGVACCFLVGRV